MAQIFGPSGKGAINFDSFQTSTPPPAPPAGVKVINPADKKTGPGKPSFLGGTSKTGHAHGDTYWE
jgi:hypothetical protein